MFVVTLTVDLEFPDTESAASSPADQQSAARIKSDTYRIETDQLKKTKKRGEEHVQKQKRIVSIALFIHTNKFNLLHIKQFNIMLKHFDCLKQ